MKKTITADKLNELMRASSKLSGEVAAFINVNRAVLPPAIVTMLSQCHDRTLNALQDIDPLPGGIEHLLITEPEAEVEN